MILVTWLSVTLGMQQVRYQLTDLLVKCRSQLHQHDTVDTRHRYCIAPGPLFVSVYAWHTYHSDCNHADFNAQQHTIPVTMLNCTGCHAIQYCYGSCQSSTMLVCWLLVHFDQLRFIRSLSWLQFNLIILVVTKLGHAFGLFGTFRGMNTKIQIAMICSSLTRLKVQ